MIKTAAARDFKLIDVRAEADRMVADNPSWVQLQRAIIQATNFCSASQPDEIRQSTVDYIGRVIDGFLAPEGMAALGRQAIDFQRRISMNWEKQCRFEIDYNTFTFNYPCDISPELRLHAAVEVEKYEEAEKRAQRDIATLDKFASEVDSADIGIALLIDLTARVAEEGMAEGAAGLIAKIDKAFDTEGAVRRALASSSSDILLGALRERTLPKVTIHESCLNQSFH